MRVLSVGDVLRYSWGYDQTNVDAFEVTRTSAACVWVRPIALRSVRAESWGSDRCEPVRGQYIGPEIRKRRKRAGWAGEEEFVTFDHGLGRLWPEGASAFRSWYA